MPYRKHLEIQSANPDRLGQVVISITQDAEEIFFLRVPAAIAENVKEQIEECIFPAIERVHHEAYLEGLRDPSLS